MRGALKMGSSVALGENGVIFISSVKRELSSMPVTAGSSSVFIALDPSRSDVVKGDGGSTAGASSSLEEEPSEDFCSLSSIWLE